MRVSGEPKFSGPMRCEPRKVLGVVKVEGVGDAGQLVQDWGRRFIQRLGTGQVRCMTAVMTPYRSTSRGWW